MAWQGTTNSYAAKQFKEAGAKWASTNTDLSTSVQTNQTLPGFTMMTTPTDVAKIYASRPDGKMGILALFRNSASTGKDTVYGVVSLRVPESSDKLAFRAPVSGYIGSSTAESGWRTFGTTATLDVGTSEGALLMCGPFETAKYGHKNDSTTYGSGQYFECMFHLSTIAPNANNTGIPATTTEAHALDSTTLNMVCSQFCAFELP